MISEQERELALHCVKFAQENGAQKTRVTLNKTRMDIVSTLDGEVDKVTACLDRSVTLSLFVDGRFGSFSTNDLETSRIEGFIAKAILMVRNLESDRFRDLPPKERCYKDAVGGDELKLYDHSYDKVSSKDRIRMALEASEATSRTSSGKNWKLISEEGEYSDSEFDSLLVDSNGLECRHSETSFEYGVEVTIQDDGGEKYSAYWWHADPFLDKLRHTGCGPEAVRRAVSQIGAEPAEGGKYTVVLESEVASKVVKPIINALNAYSLQQNNSFLMDSLGKKIFPEALTLIDDCHRPGETGSRLFDSEGVCTEEGPVIEKGTVKKYFINTYMSGKTGWEPTVEDITRARILPWPENGLKADDIMQRCRQGILVTGFNGGNCNSSSGDFSYGIEGFLFKDGKIVRPISEMLMTGNIITLWKGLKYAGEDARQCMSKLIPTLAFENVDFSG